MEAQKLNNGEWHLLTDESDFLIKQKGFQYREPDFPVAQG